MEVQIINGWFGEGVINVYNNLKFMLGAAVFDA
jgi:hypothetical protein